MSGYVADIVFARSREAFAQAERWLAGPGVAGLGHAALEKGLQARGREIARLLLFGNITPEFASTIGVRTVAERARSSSFLGLDAILISGPEAGVPFVMSDLRAAKEAAPLTPVLANTGVTADRLAETLAVADGVIVGTSLKVDGITWNPVDPDRAKRFVDVARSVRSAPAAAAG
jgi:uncharacterized protein